MPAVPVAVSFEVDCVVDAIDAIREYASDITLDPVTGKIHCVVERSDEFSAGRLVAEIEDSLRSQSSVQSVDVERTKGP